MAGEQSEHAPAPRLNAWQSALLTALIVGGPLLLLTHDLERRAETGSPLMKSDLLLLILWGGLGIAAVWAYIARSIRIARYRRELERVLAEQKPVLMGRPAPLSSPEEDRASGKFE